MQQQDIFPYISMHHPEKNKNTVFLFFYLRVCSLSSVHLSYRFARRTVAVPSQRNIVVVAAVVGAHRDR